MFLTPLLCCPIVLKLCYILDFADGHSGSDQVLLWSDAVNAFLSTAEWNTMEDRKKGLGFERALNTILEDLTKVHFKARLDEMIDVDSVKAAEGDPAAGRHRYVSLLGSVKVMVERLINSCKGGQPVSSASKAFREVKNEIVPLHAEMPGAL